MAPLWKAYNFFPRDHLLVYPETLQTQHLGQYACTIHGFFEKPKFGNETWFWNSFAKPIENANRVQHFYSRVRIDKDLSPLERLPSELIEQVLNELVDTYDIPWMTRRIVLALGLSSRLLYPTVLAHIHRDHTSRLTLPWAGKNVGHHGGFSHCTSSQVLAYKQERSFKYRQRLGTWTWTLATMQPETEWYEAVDGVKRSWTLWKEKDWQNIKKDVSQMYMYPQDRVWVLRNLTTRQCVRSDNLIPPASIVPHDEKTVPKATRPKQKLMKLWKSLTTRSKDKDVDMNKHDAREPLTLPQIFLILTTYSHTNNLPPFEKKFQFHDGPWTAHSFDVVTLEDHLDTPTDLPWTDISAAVVADIGHLRWCVRQAEIARTWTESEAAYLDDVISKGRKEWRRWIHDAGLNEEGMEERASLRVLEARR